MHEISGGEFQKVRLARSFVQGSDFLLLDEPLSSLDFTAAKNFMSLLKEKCKKSDKAVILSIHDINTACAFADKIILLGKCRERKQLFFVGNVNQVMTSKNLSLVYESTVQIFAHPLLGVPQV